jgi:hypothetical protein
MNKNKHEAPTQRPTICRVVVFRSSFDEEHWNGASEHPAMITGVVSDDVVNLMVFPDGAAPVTRMRVCREGSFEPTPGFPSHAWAWPSRQ